VDVSCAIPPGIHPTECRMCFCLGPRLVVAQAAKRATQAHQLSIRHFCDLKPELLNVELLKAVVIGDLALVIFRGRREAGER
jgi:hypothetical protein